jgi:hypothetical protein
MRIWVWLLPLSGAFACATSSYAQVRRDASQRWGCPESAIDVETQGADVLRATGCGKSLIYVCSGSRGGGGDKHSTLMTEEEARFGGNADGECHAR